MARLWWLTGWLRAFPTMRKAGLTNKIGLTPPMVLALMVFGVMARTVE